MVENGVVRRLRTEAHRTKQGFLVAETDPNRPRRPHEFSTRINGLHMADSFADIHGANAAVAQRDHLAIGRWR